jgi:hypothetical protein
MVKNLDLREPIAPKAVSKVKGPIRCHKCQLKCSDAEQYLSHNCQPRSLSDSVVVP